LLWAAGLPAATVELAPTDAYAGPSKPKPVLASKTQLQPGKEYQLTVKPVNQSGRRVGSVFEIATQAKDSWLTIEATTVQAGYEWGICDLRGRYIVTRLTAGSGTQKVQLKARKAYALYFEYTGPGEANAIYLVKLTAQ
jgi:hypothetical protein